MRPPKTQVLYLCATRVDRSHRDAVGIVVMSAFLSFVTMIEMPMFGNIDVEPPGRSSGRDSIAVRLVEPLASLRGISRFLTFDLDTLRLACWLGMGGGSSPLLNYLGTLMAYPLLVILICFALLVGKVALGKDITWNTVIHAQGVLILAAGPCHLDGHGAEAIYLARGSARDPFQKRRGAGGRLRQALPLRGQSRRLLLHWKASRGSSALKRACLS